ncbi:hypothetical protein K2173_003917 [Erythroxylum novogranatense]|uniref:DYW domain-containing protein n=1 Tax=Erythroxylum novogranatense TaxID=1862640 RepID=A0AAV8SJX2_9ROSI|nr:hypothetical protein K2173_003917 [Erythroxylum novogranatense]
MIVKRPTFSLRPTITHSILETVLKRCHIYKQFKQILSQMILTGFINDTFAASRLLKFSTDSPFIHVNYSQKIFTHIEYPNGFIYNTMMRAYLQTTNPERVMSVYKFMLQNYDEPDNFSYPILLQSCSLRLAEFEGKLIQAQVLKMGFGIDVYINNTLITMYAVCGNLSDARRVFDESPVLDLVSWNSILAGYVSSGDIEEAKYIYDRMPERNIIASNSMIVLFGRKGNVVEALRLFNEMTEKDLVSWSALISCYEKNDMHEEALAIFKAMNANKVIVDEVMVISVLSACCHLAVVKIGKSIHGLVLKIGLSSYINLQNALIHMYSSGRELMDAQKLFGDGCCLDQISWNSMINGYVTSGEIEKAKALFDSMPEKDIVSWTVMISGYVQNERFDESLTLFQKMQLDGIRPDETTLVSVLSACTHLSALDQGRWIHAYIKRTSININVILGTTLIDMYMKFGFIESALEIFHEMKERRVSTWNALILGLALNGLVNESLNMFSEMHESGVVPNEITFIAVLAACRHMGLVDDGRNYFNSMINEHRIEPNVKHYGCMVDLLGRAGMLKEAEDLIKEMPMPPDVSTWGALLGACKKYGDKEMGERVGRRLIEIQPDHEGFHVLLSNIYASKGNWNDVIELREVMMQQGVVKTPGCSMIEANGTVHEFLAGDKSHPQIEAIEQMLDEIAYRLKMDGYAPNTHEVHLDIDEEEKEINLFRHSEKLAIAFGLVTISHPAPIRIMKNLRICNDCHTAAKLISQSFDREIVVRDRHRFHHFKQGSCSCMDYW